MRITLFDYVNWFRACALVTSIVGNNELLVPVSKVSVLKMSQRSVDFDRYFGRPRQRWEDNIKMDLKEVEWEGVDQNDLNQGRNNWQAVMNTVVNFRGP